MRVKFILGSALMLLVLIFSLQNGTPVEVNFFAWTFVVSLAVVVFVTLAAGLLGGWVLTSALRLRKRHRKEPP